MANEIPEHMPPPEILEERRKRKFIIDPSNITPQAQARINQWARTLMKKHESKLSFARYKDRDFVASGEVKAEDLDISILYDAVKYSDFHWWLRREKDKWALTLTFRDQYGRQKIATKHFFANLKF